MKVSILVTITLLSGFVYFCQADAVVYETDFQELPDNWYATTFEFGTSGALIDFDGLYSFDANLNTGDGIPGYNTIFIPDGTDSVHVSISQNLHVSGGEEPNMEFQIFLSSESYGSDLVWDIVINSQTPQCNHSGTFVFTPDWLQAGEYLGLYFRADVTPDDWGSSVYWRIHNLTVTALGDDLSLHPTTWAGIKTSLLSL